MTTRLTFTRAYQVFVHTHTYDLILYVMQVLVSKMIPPENEYFYFENHSLMGISEQRSIISHKPLEAGFFIPAHPMWIIVPYALYLTFSSYLCPLTCLPPFLPLAPLLTSLGTSFPLMMGSFSALFGLVRFRHFNRKWRKTEISAEVRVQDNILTRYIV